MNNGWIKLHRKLLRNPISNKPNYAWLWVSLLLMANHKDNKFIWNREVIIVKEGQILTGRKELSKQTGIPEGSIDRLLNFLENEHQIKQEKTNKFRIITIINWKDYQQVNNKRTSNEHQMNTNKNVKNVKNVKKKNNNSRVEDKLLLLYKEIIPKYITIKDIHNKTSNAYIKKFTKWGDVEKVEDLLKKMKSFEGNYPYVIYSVKSLWEKKDKILARYDKQHQTWKCKHGGEHKTKEKCDCLI